MAYAHPVYPDILKKADWDKKKGVIAKAAGETGVGEAMAVCERAYAAVEWDKLELGKDPFNWKDFTKPDWDKRFEESKSELTGNVRKLVETLYKLRDTAKKTQDKFKASKLIPSSSTKHVESIARTADLLGVSLNANSVAPLLKKDYDEVVVKAVGLADMSAKVLKELLKGKSLEDVDLLKGTKPVAASMNGLLYAATRRVTQPLTNVVNCLETKGVPVAGIDPSQLPRLKQLSDIIVVWSNNASVFKDSDAPDKIKAEIKKFEAAIGVLKAMF